jgi:hypothetical protein
MRLEDKDAVTLIKNKALRFRFSLNISLIPAFEIHTDRWMMFCAHFKRVCNAFSYFPFSERSLCATGLQIFRVHLREFLSDQSIKMGAKLDRSIRVTDI